MDAGTNTLVARIPIGTSALARTVRLHEADHARYTTQMPRWEIEFRKKAKQYGIAEVNLFQLLNGLEDARISLLPVWQQRPRSVRRDALAVAMRELRALLRSLPDRTQRLATLTPHLRDADRANITNVALRSIALMFSNHKLCNSRAALNLASRAPWSAIKESIRLIHRHQRITPQVMDLLLSFHSPEKIPMPDLPSITDSILEANPDYDEDLYQHGTFNVRLKEGGEILNVVRPPLSADCITPGSEIPTEEIASTGYRIRRASLTSIACGLPVLSPFIRQQPTQPSGVVLFDASGSMHVDNQKLRRVCQLAPAATVLYYSASSDEGPHTFLVIYAQNGKRLSDSTPMPNHYGGNGRDDLAIQFALNLWHSQGADRSNPLLLVSDCGWGTYDAQPIVDNAISNGSLRLIGSIDAAIAEFSLPHQNS